MEIHRRPRPRQFARFARWRRLMNKLQYTLEGRPFGHPLHPLLSHLPLGLWMLGLVFDIVAIATGQPWPIPIAAWSLLVGTLAAVLAIITGLNDFIGLRRDHPAQNTAVWHMLMMFPASALFAID